MIMLSSTTSTTPSLYRVSLLKDKTISLRILNPYKTPEENQYLKKDLQTHKEQ